jgi:hypothetical protein
LKRKHRAFVSKKVGHEVNTDEEREYDKAEKERADRWLAEFDAKWKAEEARREALSPESEGTKMWSVQQNASEIVYFHA